MRAFNTILSAVVALGTCVLATPVTPVPVMPTLSNRGGGSISVAQQVAEMEENYIDLSYQLQSAAYDITVISPGQYPLGRGAFYSIIILLNSFTSTIYENEGLFSANNGAVFPTVDQDYDPHYVFDTFTVFASEFIAFLTILEVKGLKLEGILLPQFKKDLIASLESFRIAINQFEGNTVYLERDNSYFDENVALFSWQINALNEFIQLAIDAWEPLLQIVAIVNGDPVSPIVNGKLVLAPAVILSLISTATTLTTSTATATPTPK